MDQHIKDWCYAECERQHATTPGDIAGMQAAWEFAEYMTHSPGQAVGVGMIRDLAAMIDPVANPEGRFRTGPAVFLNGGVAAAAHDILSRIYDLVETLTTFDPFDREGSQLTPDEFYQELMYIHPFKDGNGRVGALIYNILNGTIDNPVVPPVYR